jgi:hypothetical protein
MWGCFDNRVSVLVIRVLVFSGFCSVCTVFWYDFVYVDLVLFFVFMYCVFVRFRLCIFILISLCVLV